MNPIPKKLFADIGIALLLAILIFHLPGFAQSSFDIPTLLPAKDESIGGNGDACVGLATMIRTGNIHLRNLPCFIKFISQTLIGVAGSLAVVFVMIGGYRYVLGGTEDKESAKKTITFALIGLAISLMAWIITDLVLQVATE